MKYSEKNLKGPILLFIFFAIFASACSMNINEVEPETINVQKLIEIEEKSISASGKVVPLVKAELSFQNNAKNLQVMVKPGDEVNKGDILIESDFLQQMSDVESAKARLADAESSYDILKRNFARKIDQDAALANIEAAASALELAQDNFRLTKLIAPFSGTVIDVNVNSYEDVNAGEPVILLADMQNLVIETTDLNEIDVKKISVGNSVEISYDAFPEIRIQGQVTDIKLKSDSGAGVNYTATIAPKEKLENLRWGMSAFVVIQINSL